MNLSVRNALTGLWILLLATCVGLAFFLVELYQQSANTQQQQTQKLVEHAGELVNKRYETYVANSGDTRTSLGNKPDEIRELNLLLSLVLAQFDGIEGGYWTPKDGFEAYAFPTYGGAGVKKDLPTTELSTISRVAQDAIRSKLPKLSQFNREHRTLIVYARPVQSQEGTAVLWTMGWCDPRDTELLTQVIVVLIVLFLCSLLSGIWLTCFLFQWSSKVTALEAAISGVAVEELPELSKTGLRELDRVVIAFNQLNQRLKQSQAASAQLTQELARADKLSALGRMVAGFAHEIRNPLATICLSAENALEKNCTNQNRLLTGILQEAQQLEGLLQKLLAVAKLNELKPMEIDLNSWVKEQVEHCRAVAEKKGVVLTGQAPSQTWSFDRDSFSRALNNLVQNAIENTPSGGWVCIAVTVDENRCRVSVEDSGSGVPEKDREMIFEPLVTKRADGVGLGLTIVREIVEAHGGTVTCQPGVQGARFELEVPWLKS
jgi:signal transduction histidine kinase